MTWTPERRAALSKRMRKQWRDSPSMRTRQREGLKAWHLDPARNPLAALTSQERSDYDMLRKLGGTNRADRFRILKRTDLLPKD